MAINPITGTALQGIQRGLQGVRRSAAEIASQKGMSSKFPHKDMVRSMVELHQSTQQVSTSVKAFKAADQAIGKLLDVKA
jgi:hypothetical protein